MNCWIIWWTGNSKFKISSLIRQMKIKKSYPLKFLFYFWCFVLCHYQLLSWTAVNFAFRMLGCCLDLLKFPYIYFILCIDQLEASVFELLKIGLFKHPPLPRTKIVFKAQTTVKNSWVAGGMLKPIGILYAGKGLAHGGFWYTLKYMSFKNKFSVHPPRSELFAIQPCSCYLINFLIH